MKISHSQAKTWLRCKKQWEFKYIHGLRPKQVSRPLLFGSLAHGMLEAHYKGKKPKRWVQKFYKDGAPWDQDEEQVFMDVLRNMEDYFEFYSNDNFKIIETELAFELPFGDHILKGVIDGVWKDIRGHHWLVEHKTGKRELGSDDRMWDLQAHIYHWAYKQLRPKAKLKGTMWNYISSTPIGEPRGLADGGLSRAVNQRTTWKRYREALVDRNINPADYEDMRDVLESQQDRWFNRRWLPARVKTTQTLMQELEQIATEIETHQFRPRALDRHCSWCDYSELCKLDIARKDWSHEAETDFVKDEETGTRR